MKRILTLALVFLSFVLDGQVADRYLNEVFSIVESSDIVFSTGVPQPKVNTFNIYVLLSGAAVSVREYDTEGVNLSMDIFEPANDGQEMRPLVIICFGGGFVEGSRDHWSIRRLAEGLARRGYVTATIDYRLGMHIFDREIGKRAVYRAVQDSRSAVRFFRANAATYKIDPDKIFIGGHSAGAFVALHNLYLDKESERPSSTFDTLQDGNVIPDLSCLDCVGNNLGFNGRANGVFSLAGAVGDVTYLENANDAPPIFFHDSTDATVPYKIGEPFSDISGLIFGSELPTVYGSQPTSQRCDELNIPNDLHVYGDRGHGVHENGMMTLYPDILPLISDWFYEQDLKPLTADLEGDLRFCAGELSQSYNVDREGLTYFDWNIEGGVFVNSSTSSESVEVLWDENANSRQLSLLAYSENGAQGELKIVSPTLVADSQNTWIGSNGNWNQASNWSTGEVPLTCEDVIIPEGVDIVIPSATSYSIQTLTLNLNSLLSIPSSSELLISEE